ncbi:MAG: hypothetical protein DWQ47_12930 [Acidobacteria bacterium]|nr:MAG: hypothetical protein DWQ32_00330 [Acidobacteriota bacterium]REK03014.1 MAG: hypothetical protein DWQ38_11805 [Acidobacteriota bacterium]REK13182.1 MAG: hypothetical protein DWQ43_06020 [Acidobacteriota bacterium]REK41176.1 MAG: hypothetical protein DWQ47_12930 [Acidobacteriota bacterium]
MLRKGIFTSLFLFAFFVAAAIPALAQAQVSGRVELKKADGTTEPVAGASVDCYRTDSEIGCRSATTNDKGEFTFLGIPYNGTVALAVSGPGIAPIVYPGIKAGNDKVVVQVSEGDGSGIDEAEARRVAAAWAANPTGELTEEQRKAQEEYERKLREINEKNAKIEEKNALVERVLKEGNTAFQAKDYDTAIAKFHEGYEADPDFAGSAPLLLNNKGMALKQRAVIVYNEGAQSKDSAKLAAAKKAASEDLSLALESFSKALEVASQTGAAEIRTPELLKKDKFTSADGGRDAIRLMVLIKAVDSERAEAAKNVIGYYLEAEQDKGKKAEAQGALASFLLEGYDYEGAVAEFRKAYEMSSSDPEIVGKFGLALFTLSEVNQDAAMKQESLNYMDKYLSVAPQDHSLRDGIQGAVEALKAEGMKPQKLD